MTAPIQGPLTEEVGKTTTGPSMEYVFHRRYKQSYPFDKSLPYYVVRHRINSYDGTDAPGYNAFSNASYNGYFDNVICNGLTCTASAGPYQATLASAKSECFERAISQMSDNVELLVSLAERREAYEMMVKRMIQLARLVKAIRHPSSYVLWGEFFPLTGRFLLGEREEARRVLKHYVRNWRSLSKDLGKTWLELHFGWEPIVRDIDTCLQLLNEPLKPLSITAKSRKLQLSYVGQKERSGPFSLVTGSFGGWVRVSTSFDCVVDDEKEVYKSLLGFNNPVQTLYSLIPYSWMFDWVNYLGSWISQWSALSGYKVIEPCHGIRWYAGGASRYESPKGIVKKKNSWSSNSFERVLGIPRVTIGWRPLKRVSIVRGATAASILAGLFDPRDPINRERVSEFRKLQPLQKPK